MLRMVQVASDNVSVGCHSVQLSERAYLRSDGVPLVTNGAWLPAEGELCAHKESTQPGGLRGKAAPPRDERLTRRGAPA